MQAGPNDNVKAWRQGQEISRQLTEPLLSGEGALSLASSLGGAPQGQLCRFEPRRDLLRDSEAAAGPLQLFPAGGWS